MGHLKGKVAIVTGASRGIGKALAATAAGLGSNVVVAARTEGPLKETAQELAKEYKVEVVPVACDVTKLSDLENLVHKTKEKFGQIDILINNAGVSSQYLFEKQPFEDFERLVHTILPDQARALCCESRVCEWIMGPHNNKSTSNLPVSQTIRTRPKL